jgi:hypothetical protein
MFYTPSGQGRKRSDQRCRVLFFACRRGETNLSEFSESGKADHQIPRDSFGVLAHRSSSRYSSSAIIIVSSLDAWSDWTLVQLARTQGVSSDFDGLDSTQKESLKLNSIIISYE